MKLKVGFVICSILLVSCNGKAKKDGNELMINLPDQSFKELIAIRNDIHNNPEISGEEKRTSKIVEDYLIDLGLEVKKGFGGQRLSSKL